jgi:hypothetical protein
MMRTRWCRSSERGLWTRAALACVVAVVAAAPATAHPLGSSPFDGAPLGKRAGSTGVAARY